MPGLLKVLGDPTRLRILALLEREELRVGELSRALGLSQSRVSNHLRVLREAGLLVERHSGKSIFLRHGAPGEIQGESSESEDSQVFVIFERMGFLAVDLEVQVIVFANHFE